MFGTINVHAGDFSKNDHHQYMDGAFLMETAPTAFGLRGKRERIPISDVIEFETADKDNMENLADSIGWSMAGKAVAFTATFSDNRKIFATTDNQTYVKIKAAIWEKKNISKPDNKNTASDSAPTEFPLKYEVEKPWSDNVALVVVLMIFLWPIGFWGLWRSKSITTESKMLWTAIFVVLLIIGFITSLATAPN